MGAHDPAENSICGAEGADMRFVRGGPRNWTALLIVFLVGLMCGNTLKAQTGGVNDSAVQEQVEVTEVTPQVLVLATSTGNVVASVGPDGALLVGTPSRASTARISEVLA